MKELSGPTMLVIGPNQTWRWFKDYEFMTITCNVILVYRHFLLKHVTVNNSSIVIDCFIFFANDGPCLTTLPSTALAKGIRITKSNKTKKTLFQ